MIHAIDRFHAKHPKLAISIAVLAAFICLYIADQFDNENDAVIRWSMAANRSQT